MKKEYFTSKGEPGRGLAFNGKGKALTNGTCDRCGGQGGATSGSWMAYDPGGMAGNCFKCLGKGVVTMRAYTKKEYDALARNRERAAEKRAAKWEAAKEARFEAQRERNGGLTDAELDDKIMAEREAKKKLLIKLLSPLGEAIEDGKGGFCDSIGRDLQRGNTPAGRGAFLVCEILAKKEGRKNSKAFEAEFDRIEKVLEKAKELENA